MTAPQRFRSRPQTVEAVQWLGEENANEVIKFLGIHGGIDGNYGRLQLVLANGEIGGPGEWIVKYGPGRFEVLTDAEFRAAYDPEPTNDAESRQNRPTAAHVASQGMPSGRTTSAPAEDAQRLVTRVRPTEVDKG